MDPNKKIVNQDKVEQCNLSNDQGRCPAGKEIPIDKETSGTEAPTPEPMDVGEDG